MRVQAPDPTLDPALLAAFGHAVGAAGESVATMSEGRLRFTAPRVGRLSLDEILAIAGGPEVPVAGVYVGFSGGLDGHGVLLLPGAEARRLAQLILGDLAEPDEGPERAADDGGLSALERSALEEVANVAVSTTLIGLADHLALTIHAAVPVFVYDMAGAILDAIVSDVARSEASILAARTSFQHAGREASGVLLVVPRPAPDEPDR